MLSWHVQFLPKLCHEEKKVFKKKKNFFKKKKNLSHNQGLCPLLREAELGVLEEENLFPVRVELYFGLAVKIPAID